MRYRVEIYHYERRIENVLKRIQSPGINPKNKTVILDFYRDSLSRGLSKARILKYLTTHEIIARLFSKPFKGAKDDTAGFWENRS